MKESDITQPVIDKCKQISEHWRMEIYVGCWIICSYLKMDVVVLHHGVSIYKGELIPIPSISDCLEKLRELRALSAFGGGATKAITAFLMGQITITKLHESLLSALLEVLKND